jgi:hypothetical protein
MLSGAIAYQILQREKPETVSVVRALLEKNPWYEKQWRGQLEKLPEADRDEYLFMLAARWADDIRRRDPADSHPPWHNVRWPFKPHGEPVSLTLPPTPPENILKAIADNQRLTVAATDLVRKAVALTWIFHLTGDIHQPLHTSSLITQDYPTGDRGGNAVCIRVSQDRAPLDLHKFWDDLLISSNNRVTLKNLATELRSRFPRSSLPELEITSPQSWAKESFEIAVKIAYQNGAFRGTPKGQQKECREVANAQVLPTGYVTIAKRIAERRIMLAGYRLVELLERPTRK